MTDDPPSASKRPHAARQKHRAWLGTLGGILGSIWLIVWSGHVFQSLYPGLSSLGRGVLSLLCLFIIAFALNGVTPPLLDKEIDGSKIASPWAFVRRARPEDPVLRSLWWKYLRGLVLMAGIVLCMAMWAVGVSFGLMKAG